MSVDDYIAAQPKPAQALLGEVRAAIRKAVPNAKEMISYNIPGYKLPGGRVLSFAGWKQHYSLYPATKALQAAFGDELKAYEVRNATIRFPLGKDVPTELIGRIARFLANKTDERLQ